MTMTSEMTSRCFTIFITILSLITFAVFLSELLHPYSFLPDSLGVFVEILDWQTRINSSALAFGAIIFVLYELYMTVAELLIYLSLRVWNMYSAVELAAENTQERSVSSFSLMSAYVSALVTAIIVNDSVYNRALGTPIVSGSVDRLVTMAYRAFPVCGIELALLFLIFFVIGCWTTRSSQGTSNGRRVSDLESGATRAADSKPLLQPTRATLYMTPLIDGKLCLEKEEFVRSSV